MNNAKQLLLMLLLTVLLCACSAQQNAAHQDTTQQDEAQEISYRHISAEEAKAIIDSEEDYVILDVRTESEYAEGHIEGAILIPDYEIALRAENELPDKNALILVYCRSGRRSKSASEELAKLGYTNVLEFGGIIDWKYGTTAD